MNTSVFVLTGYTGAVASVTNALSFGFTVAFGDDNFTVGTNGVLRLTAAQNGAATITASVRVSDGNSLITLSYTLLAAEEFRFAPDKLAATITTYGDNRALLTALAVGPLSAVRYARISVVPADLEIAYGFCRWRRCQRAAITDDGDNAELIHPSVREH